MIVADLKSLAEIAASIAGVGQVHVLGCGGCVTVCRSGGQAEAGDLVHQLAHPRHYPSGAAEHGVPRFTVDTIERQCERDLLEAFLAVPPDTGLILSLGCGVGVQTLADVYDPLPVVPALTTTFMGGVDEPGIWREKCRGCGQCLLAFTGGICPVSRCAKSLLNGPCGGPRGGNCEISEDLPCAWGLIHDRLERQGRLDLLDEIQIPRDHRLAGGNGPRVRRRIGLQEGATTSAARQVPPSAAAAVPAPGDAMRQLQQGLDRARQQLKHLHHALGRPAD